MKSKPSDEQRAVFITLQPILQQLLQAANDPDRLCVLLKTFTDLLKSTPFLRLHLQSCFDYVWLPFQYMLASVAHTRKLRDLPPKPSAQASAPVPAIASQLVAEKAMQSIQAILEVAGPAELSALLTILTPLAELTHLDPATSNEHIMLSVLGSVSAILARISAALQSPQPSAPETQASWAVTAGLLFHGLLNTTEAERAGTGFGAPKLATAALRATDAVVQALRTQPDRVAFYLPGLVSKTTALLSQSPSSLPPSAHTAACCVLRSVLSITLDPATLPSGTLRAAESAGAPAGGVATPPDTPNTPLAALRALARAGGTSPLAQLPGAEAAAAAAPAAAAPAEAFACDRDAAWLRDTTATLQSRLEAALAALRCRRSPKTRAASAALATAALRRCAGPLGPPITLLLMRHVLLLSADSAQVVSEPCMDLMHEVAAADGGGGWVRRAVAQIKAQCIVSLRRAEALLEVELQECCRSLAAAIRAQPPGDAVQEGPGALLGLVGRLLEVDVAAAELWLQGHSGVGAPGGGALVARSAQGPAAAVQSLLTSALAGVAASPGADGGEGVAQGLAAATAAKAAAAAALASVPSGSGGDMPPGLKLVQTEEAFRAVEGVGRAVGWACSALAGAPRDGGPGDGGAAAVAAVDSVRVRVEDAVPAWRQGDGDTTLTEGLLQQAQALGSWVAFVRGCAAQHAAQHTAQHAARHVDSAEGENGKGAVAAGGSKPQGGGGGQDASADGRGEEEGGAPDNSGSGSAADALWSVLRLGTRSIVSAASKALQAGEQAVAALDAEGADTAAAENWQAGGRELRTAAAVHAHAFTTAIAALACHAPAAFRADPAVLRAALLPLLQSAASGPPFVVAEASSALSALCTCLDHKSWPELVSANLDYVVDGLMRQIQQPDVYPRAPHLLAALFSSSHVTRALLPALAEPAAAAVQNLSILSRAAHPRHTAAYLQALAPVAAAAAQEGAALRAAASAAVAAVRQRADAAEAAARGARSARLEAAADAAAGSGGSAEAYFEAYNQGAGGEGEGPGGKLRLTAEETAALEARRWATYSAAELASSVCSAAAPLLVAEDLRVALAAHTTVTEALVALSHLTDADDFDGRELVEGLELKNLAPLPGEPERLLPQVHATWGFMVPGLRTRAEAARLEAALQLLVRVAQLAGDFILRRYKADALPALRPLLRGAAAVGVRAAQGGGAITEGAAAGTVVRGQDAALRAVAAMCENPCSAAVVAGGMEVAGDAVGAMCAAGAPASAAAAVRALARVDADAVWLRVHRAAEQAGPRAHGAFERLLADIEALPVPWHGQFRQRCGAVVAE